MITGRCLCRAITFAYDAAPRWTLNCHCESCRRATSTAMTTWIWPRYAKTRRQRPALRHGPRK